MATQLRFHSTDNRLFSNTIDRIDRDVQDCLEILKITKPRLVMRWTEAPDGELRCHWDIDPTVGRPPTH